MTAAISRIYAAGMIVTCAVFLNLDPREGITDGEYALATITASVLWPFSLSQLERELKDQGQE